MIITKIKPNSEEEIFNVMHPLIKKWFTQKFQKFTPPQLYGLLEIHSRNNILVSASTGSGKSLTCFLSILNELVDSSEKGILEDRTYCVYISPLKALSNDIEVNLKEPLKEMEEIYGKKLGIRVGVRTGDTTTAERTKMAARPPHILITTPESLGILLNTIKFKEHLRKVDWIAVDELHSLAENKRGVHLSLTLERLQQLSPGACRIGLSATVAPLETVAMYLAGNKDCIIVDAPFLKELDLKVISPVTDLIETTYDSMNKQTYELLDQLIQEHKTTIIFTNTRAGTERVVNHLKTKFPKNYSENIGAHHGSLSREHRLDLEQKMRDGKLKVCVTSTSLELGIDIGYIDLVILLGSPKSVARAKQRCLPYDSRILLSGGVYKAIGEIVEHKLDVPVQSYDIKKKKFVKNKIIDYHKRISRHILNIKLHSESLLRCTYEHPIMTQTGWKKASQLTEGEYVAEIFDLKNKHYKKGPTEKDVDANISWTKILTITKENKKQQVYNITLKSEPNNYYAESLLTHNCGRAGHKLHDTIKGRIIVLDRDDLIENAVLSKHVVEHNIDRIHIPTNCLDVLAQQIYGIAISEQINIKELYALIKNSYCYQTLKWEEFLEVIDYLSGKYSTLEERHIYAKIWYDEETGMIGKRGKLARIVYMTNIGTIPDESFISVKIGDYIIGKIDENFLEKLKPGDIFVLGGNTYQFKHAKGMVAYVSAAIGRTPTVPSWVSDMLPLSFDLAMSIQRFRKLMEEKLKKYDKEEVLKFIQEYLYVGLNTADAIFNYFYEQYKYLEIPHEKKILIEHYDEDKKKYVVFHALYGRKVNEVLSRAVAYVLSKTEKKDLEIGVNDNGFYLSFDKRINVTGVINKIKSKDMNKIMTLAIDKTEIIKRRFRHCATRALMILRTYKGQTKRVGRQQVSSMILLSAVRKISENFPILKETRREILEDLMDIENAKNVMKEIEDGKITIKEVYTNIPSPFAFNLVLQGKMDIMKADDKIEFLKRIHKDVMLKIKMRGG